MAEESISQADNQTSDKEPYQANPNQKVYDIPH
jgi:hypothetical protein